MISPSNGSKAAVMTVRGQKQHQELEEGSEGEEKLTSTSAPCGINVVREQQNNREAPVSSTGRHIALG